MVQCSAAQWMVQCTALQVGIFLSEIVRIVYGLSVTRLFLTTALNYSISQRSPALLAGLVVDYWAATGGRWRHAVGGEAREKRGEEVVTLVRNRLSTKQKGAKGSKKEEN